MKQTAVEWYEKEINSLFEKYEAKQISPTDFLIMKHNLFYPAKEMEKEQILNAWSVATNPDYEIGFGDMFYILEQEKKAEQYYNETFNIKEK